MELPSSSAMEAQTQRDNIKSTLKRIASYKGVIGYFFIHPDTGRVLKSEGFGNDEEAITRYSTKLKGFIDIASSTIRTLDSSDNMTFLRISCGNMDILAAPSPEEKYTLIVVQEVE